MFENRKEIQAQIVRVSFYTAHIYGAMFGCNEMHIAYAHVPMCVCIH